MDIHKRKWNSFYGKKGETPVVYDPWLDRYLDRLEASKDRQVLDLGCGTGNNTKYLLEKGFSVIPVDYSKAAIELIRRNFPTTDPLVFDMRNTFPFTDGSLGAIVADLSIHYFDWATTLGIAKEINRCLASGGYFLCRVNSVRDSNHGAGKGKEVETNYFLRFGERKRFFDEASVDGLLASGFEAIDKREATIRRYAKEKKVWEFAAVKRG